MTNFHPKNSRRCQTPDKAVKPKKPKVVTDESDINAVALRLNIANWDVIIVSDGSGTGWTLGCGWAAVLIDRHNRTRKIFSGAFNTGTIGIGELIPTIHALLWFSENDGRALRKQYGRPLRIHVLTDSEYVADTGTALRSGHTALSDVKNAALWAGVMELDRRGFGIEWHWIPRESLALNVYCDHLSRQSRLGIQEVQVPSDPTTNEPLSVFDLNPHPRGVRERRQLRGARKKAQAHVRPDRTPDSRRDSEGDDSDCPF